MGPAASLQQGGICCLNPPPLHGSLSPLGLSKQWREPPSKVCPCCPSSVSFSLPKAEVTVL